MKRNKFKKRKSNSSSFQNKLNLFQKPDMRFKKLSSFYKKCPVVDYKNIKLLKKYVSDTGKILPSRITSVCQNKQRKLNVAIKRAQVLGLI